MMSNSEKISRKKVRVSIIDVLIFVTVIACVAGTFVHYKVFEKNNTVITDDVFSVSVLFSDVLAEISDKVVVGDKIYSKDGNRLLGTVVEVTSEDAAIYYRNANDEIVEGIDNSKRDLTVIIEVRGQLTANGFLANGTDYLACGMDVDIFSSKFSGNGLVFDVKKQTE